MLQLITQFTNNYCDAIDGTSAQVQEASRETGELQGGARINHIFRYEFAQRLEEMVRVRVRVRVGVRVRVRISPNPNPNPNQDPCTGLSDADIAHAIKQATGPRSPLFVPEVAFGLGLGSGLGLGLGLGSTLIYLITLTLTLTLAQVAFEVITRRQIALLKPHCVQAPPKPNPNPAPNP